MWRVVSTLILFIVAAEPVIEGKPLNEWLAMLKSTEVATRRSAAAVLAQRINVDAREAAIPLAEALKDSDRKVRQDVSKAILRLGSPAIAAAVTRLADEMQSKINRNEAARGIGELGPAARAAEPLLVNHIQKMTTDKPYIVICARSLVAVDPKAYKLVLDPFINGLRDPIKEVRITCAEALGDLNPNYSNKALPALQIALGDDSSEVRIAVARTIARIDRSQAGKSATALVAVLRESSSDAAARAAAAEALGDLGKEARVAMEPLRAILKEDDAQVRLSAAVAMYAIDKQAATTETVPIIAACLKDDNILVRLAASEALKQIGPDAKAAIPALLVSLKAQGGDFGVYVNVLDAIVRVGEPAVPGMIAALNDSMTEQSLARAIIEALGKIGKPAKDAAPSLVGVLQDRKRLFLHRFAVASLAKIGAPALPSIKPLLKDEDPKLRLLAIQTITEMGSEAKPLAKELREIAKSDSEENVRRAAEAAVKKIDPFGAP